MGMEGLCVGRGRVVIKHILYGVYAALVVALFSCTSLGGGGGGGGGWGSASSRSGYSSYGAHK